MARASEPKQIRKVRTEHGTRVARSIKCSSCGASDTIHFAPTDPKRVLCRRCAADLLGVEDPDTKVGSMHPFVCASCKRSGMTEVKQPEDFLCRDCYLGIESRQGDRAKKATRLSKGVLRVRKSEPSE